jgi:hypothetical protein
MGGRTIRRQPPGDVPPGEGVHPELDVAASERFNTDKYSINRQLSEAPPSRRRHGHQNRYSAVSEAVSVVRFT